MAEQDIAKEKEGDVKEYTANLINAEKDLAEKSEASKPIEA